jgi:poly-beta-hydroxybutyrate-responsive repressor
MCDHPHDSHHRHSGCRCPEGRVRRFLQPQLLLLLVQKPTHGYDLMERLTRDAESPAADPALLYRTLRQFEDEGLVRSSWDTEGRGPARRLYEVTPEGMEYLHTWAVNIRQTRRQLDSFLSEYEAHFQNEGR